MSKKLKQIKIGRFHKPLKKGSINQRVLLLILKSIKKTAKGMIKLGSFYEDLFGGFDMASVYQKVYGTYEANKETQIFKEKRRRELEIKQAIKRLQAMDYIRIDEARRKTYLTEKGILEFIKFRIQDKTSNWDNKWRMVIFDIPEKERKQRDFLRDRLKWLGFKELQKSVWIFPYDIKQDLEEALTICGASDIYGDTRFVTVDKIEEDKDLKAYFNL